MINRFAMLAAGALCGSFIAFGASAATIPVAPVKAGADVQSVQYRHGPHHMKRRCVMKRVKVRGHHGRPMYKTVRVCR